VEEIGYEGGSSGGVEHFSDEMIVFIKLGIVLKFLTGCRCSQNVRSRMKRNLDTFTLAVWRPQILLSIIINRPYDSIAMLLLGFFSEPIRS
jgi:hypothetical protein